MKQYVLRNMLCSSDESKKGYKYKYCYTFIDWVTLQSIKGVLVSNEPLEIGKSVDAIFKNYKDDYLDEGVIELSTLNKEYSDTFCLEFIEERCVK